MILRNLLLMCGIAITLNGSAQFISLRATHASQFISDGLYDPDVSKSIGGEFIYSKPVNFIKWPINYNIGIDYRNTDGAHAAYAATGLTWVTRTPSGFMFAPNAESVTYVTSNWLQYADINMYNGVLIGDSTYTYSMGWSLGYNIGYVFGKQFFVHFGFAGRYNTTPQYHADAIEGASSWDFMLKAGMLWKFKRKFYKA